MVKNEKELNINTFKAKHVKLETNDSLLHSDSIKNSLEELQPKLVRLMVMLL